MKQKIYTLGLVIVMVTFTGTILKVNHWPGAAILIAAGLGALVILFVPSALLNHYKAKGSGENVLLYIVTGLTCTLLFTGMLFKINHWPHAGVFLLIALPFPYIVFLPVFLWVTSKNKNFNIYNLVIVLSLLAFNSVFSGLLALSVSKDRIDDSYDIARNYNNLAKAMEQLPVSSPESDVDMKIDEAIKITGEYKAMILNAEGSSPELWSAGQGNLRRPDVGAVAGSILLKHEGEPVGGRLKNALNNVLREMVNTGGYESLLKITPEILDCKYPPGDDSGWAYWNFIDNFLPWSLIYLDAVETNLYLIKGSVPSAGKPL